MHRLDVAPGARRRCAAHRDHERAAALGGELRSGGGVDLVHRAQVAAVPQVIARRAEVQLRAEQPLDQQVAREANLAVDLAVAQHEDEVRLEPDQSCGGGRGAAVVRLHACAMRPRIG